MPRSWMLGTLILLACLPGLAPAQTCSPPGCAPLFFEPTFPGCNSKDGDSLCSALSRRDPFTGGTWNVQMSTGYAKRTGAGSPELDFLPQSMRLGYMANTPYGDGYLRGSCELMLEYDYSPISKTFGSYLTGPSLLARYNFVQQQWLVVPFVQVGAGLAFTDANRTVNQNLIGDDTLFRVRAEMGARYMVTECVSLDLALGYQFLSNARESRRNGGIDALGFAVGLTYFFGRR